jgi:hypothetical protein
LIEDYEPRLMVGHALGVVKAHEVPMSELCGCGRFTGKIE